MNRTLSELRHTDPQIDRCLREIEHNHRLSNKDSAHAMGGLVALAAYVAVIVAGVLAVLA